MYDRRHFLGLSGSAAALAFLPRTAGAKTLTPEEVFEDADAPILGNPDGDVTIAEFFDYQCSWCKKIHPDVMDVVAEDGNVRLMMKDWPVFGEASVFAAVCTAASDHAACHEMTEKRGFAGLTSFFVGLRGAGAEGLGGLDPTEVTCFQWASHETLVVGTRSGSVARLQWSDAGNHNNNHHNVGGLDALPRVGACAMHSPVFSLVDKKTKRQKVQPP